MNQNLSWSFINTFIHSGSIPSCLYWRTGNCSSGKIFIKQSDFHTFFFAACSSFVMYQDIPQNSLLCHSNIFCWLSMSKWLLSNVRNPCPARYDHDVVSVIAGQCLVLFGISLFYLALTSYLVDFMLCEGAESKGRKTFKSKMFPLPPADLLWFPDMKTNGDMMWMWHWDIKWSEVINQTLIKSVWAGVVHLPWVQNWPDLGDFPDRSVYHCWCNCTMVQFLPLKISVPIIPEKCRTFSSTHSTCRTYPQCKCIISTEEAVAADMLAHALKHIQFFSCWVFCFCENTHFNKKNCRCFVLFCLCSVSLGKCFLRSRTCQGQFQTQYISPIFSLLWVLGGRRSSCCSSSSHCLIRYMWTFRRLKQGNMTWKMWTQK